MLTDTTATVAFAGYAGPGAVGLRPELRGSGAPCAGRWSDEGGEQFRAVRRSMPVTAARVRPLGVDSAAAAPVAVRGPAVRHAAVRHATVLTTFIGTTLGNHPPGRPL